MFWVLFYLLQAYVLGFMFVSKRARTALKLADEHWSEGNENDKRKVNDYGNDISLLTHTDSLFTKEEWIHYSRNVHVLWFIISPLWADVCCVINFVFMMIKDINPQLALVFEQGINIKRGESIYEEENLELRSQIMDMQAQLNKLAKKPAKRKRKTKKKNE